MEVLMRYGREELERSGTVRFSLDTVLRRSKVSRSSLYHHFTSREGFIVALEFERSYARQMRELEGMRAFFTVATSDEQIFSALEAGLVAAGESAGRLRRQHRVETLAAAIRSDDLRMILASAQLEGTAHFKETLEQVVERGIISLRAPIDGVAYLIQSLFVGRMLVDLVDDQQIDADWVSAAMTTIRHLLGGK
ncbi:MAG: TetR/AcrR family transcriptional regulator [Ilumatobacteraceae bacterium]